ncbi:restriction endonuclease subunit S [Vibrio parahaemolyticus]|nr:restriction endonuclease subunit S [Vibrio parahaemolyticus]EGQ8948534.1 restriction endonuclease subunit S [Vibrio parahaemolyticus]EGQ8967682.1 restriction endonuclease subunit S [Vibrio parahaemolyticus]EGR3504426.1 restriction endonuclease subunit S [Vibrio parahaemolyticus]EGR3510939.1 restriction endonuclease subunit S [Vibrio parahaemolyticus]
MVKLKDCCTVVGGATPKRNISEYWDSRDVPWVTPKDISKLSNKVLDDSPEYISQLGFDKCATYLLPKGSVLLTSRAPIGNVAIAGRDMCTNQGFKSLVPSDCIDSTYLYYCMVMHSPKLEALGNGATFKEVSKKIVEEFEIPLPPLAEQKRIASILDKADAICRKRQQAIDLADEFMRAVFLDMFGDPVMNPKKFPVGTIRDFVEAANYGSSAKASEVDGEYPILRMGNITYNGAIDMTDLKYIDLSEKDKPKYLVTKGDLLFNRTNSKELVGKTAVYDGDNPVAIAGYLIRVRTNDKGNTHYISGYLNSDHGKATLQNICKSIVGMANINAQEMQDIPILIPPVDLQNKYRDIVLSVKEKLTRHQTALTFNSDLFGSLSQKAFSGDL